MCGIAGLLGVEALDGVRAMCDRLIHRGPDSAGFFVDPQAAVALGMRRLKVIDLATGDQPVFNEDRSVALVFNGEVYNYRQLRADLVARGHQFATQSDTETIVHLYEDMGERCVEQLDGMFAFALWDARQRRLLLARDQLGIKPLYYWRRGAALAFASELPALLACGEVPAAIRPAAIYDYLTYMYVPGPGTVYEGVHELEPGHSLVAERDRIHQRQYWQVTPQAEPDAPTAAPEALADELMQRVTQAVTSQLVSDVPLGAFLSGGLDSALVVALMSRHTASPVRTFTIGFRDTQFDELDQARVIARTFGTEHHEYRLDTPSADDVVSIVGAFGEPFADSSALPTHAVSKMARANVTVALSGDGGDEIFGGYNNYRADAIAEYYRTLPGWVRSLVRSAASPLALESRDGMSAAAKIGRLIRLGEMAPPDGHAWWLAVCSDEMKRSLYADTAACDTAARQATRYRDRFPSGGGRDFLNDCMAVDLSTVLPFDYLRKADRMSMANSLELRVPLLDRQLVEFLFSLPSRTKVSAAGTKLLLRQAVRGLLPHDTITGRKRGFSIPLSRWLRTEWRTLVGDVLSPAAVRRHGLLSQATVQRYVDDHLAGVRDNGKVVWVLMCLQLWLEGGRTATAALAQVPVSVNS